MKKIFLGTLTSIATIAPIFSIVSCGDNIEKQIKELATVNIESRTYGDSFDDKNSSEIIGGVFKKQNGLKIDLSKNLYGGDAIDSKGKKYQSFEKQLFKMKAGTTKIITIYLGKYWSNHALRNKKIFIKVSLINFSAKVVEIGSSIRLNFEGRAGAATWKKAKAFSGGTARNYALNVTGHSFIGAGIDQNGIHRKGFEEQMMGMKVGEEKIIDVAFPKPYQDPKLAGQHAFFKVKILSIG